jgi:HTH-type transcriptional regulator/antitoxin HigA
MKSKELIPAEATHPGQLIQDEIESLGVTQKEVATQMGIAVNILNELISGKRNLTPALALKLESFFGIDAEYWLRLQIQFELNTLRIKHKKEFEKKDIPKQLQTNMLKFISQNAAVL